MLKLLSVTTLASFVIASGNLVLPTEATAGDPTTFTVVVRNIGTNETLKLPDGKTTTAPIAPGVYAVLERGTKLFLTGQPAVTGLESLAEDGDGQALLDVVSKMNGVRNASMFVPGQPFTIKAEPGDRLVFASMFVQSNDKFYSLGPDGVELFGGQTPIEGDFTGKASLWDAGTEKDEPPGVGANQAPRQTSPNSGPTENGIVQLANDGFTYPAVAEVLQLTILPQ